MPRQFYVQGRRKPPKLAGSAKRLASRTRSASVRRVGTVSTQSQRKLSGWPMVVTLCFLGVLMRRLLSTTNSNTSKPESEIHPQVQRDEVPVLRSLISISPSNLEEAAAIRQAVYALHRRMWAAAVGRPYPENERR